MKRSLNYSQAMKNAMNSLQGLNGVRVSPAVNAATQIIVRVKHHSQDDVQNVKVKNLQHPAPFFTTVNFLSVKLSI